MGLTWPVQELDIANRLESGVEIKPSALVILGFCIAMIFIYLPFPPTFFVFFHRNFPYYGCVNRNTPSRLLNTIKYGCRVNKGQRAR